MKTFARHTVLLAALAFTALLALTPPVYAQGGVPLWTNSYAGSAVAIAVDSSGRVLVTGYSGNGTNYANYDYATLAYSNTGAPLWTNRYHGPTNLSDMPRAIAVDRSGNVFVTGSSYLPPAGPGGHGTDYKYVTVAYSSNGSSLWTNTYAAAGDAQAIAVEVDQNGNVFVTGNSVETTNRYANITTIAYSGAGTARWTNRYKGAGLDGTSYATSMALGSNGEVIAAGYSYAADGSQHYAAVAYSGAGIPLWTNQFIGPVNGSDGASAVAVDSSGNVFVTGWSDNTNGFYDYATVAYSSAGAPLWTNRYGTDSASAAGPMTVDSGGNVFVTGHSWPGVGFPDYATVAYSGAGVPLWTNRYDGPVHRDDAAVAIAADRYGNVFVTGFSTGVSTNYDYVTIGYSSGGAPLWTSRYSGPAGGNDQAEAIALDNDGNVFVTGSSWNGTDYDFATIKYSASVRLAIQKLNNEAILTWPNSAFTLQSAPALTGTFTNIPFATSPYTNPITGPQQFFRLKAN